MPASGARWMTSCRLRETQASCAAATGSHPHFSRTTLRCDRRPPGGSRPVVLQDGRPQGPAGIFCVKFSSTAKMKPTDATYVRMKASLGCNEAPPRHRIALDCAAVILERHDATVFRAARRGHEGMLIRFPQTALPGRGRVRLFEARQVMEVRGRRFGFHARPPCMERRFG